MCYKRHLRNPVSTDPNRFNDKNKRGLSCFPPMGGFHWRSFAAKGANGKDLHSDARSDFIVKRKVRGGLYERGKNIGFCPIDTDAAVERFWFEAQRKGFGLCKMSSHSIFISGFYQGWKFI
ncbi:hypothetical protein TNIN_475621 [Trichonephila inaurata madagascariensis]|uniref:Uncharacterized protein n=1 Tax=Trichonephila inaurata madagascariensis TaxID=2747483 RepID=A0A8X6WMI5_9ARAC|nr:hypothetical protein TNIN_475621 [Trichonephila inaurata madagascariensis]